MFPIIRGNCLINDHHSEIMTGRKKPDKEREDKQREEKKDNSKEDLVGINKSGR